MVVHLEAVASPVSSLSHWSLVNALSIVIRDFRLTWNVRDFRLTLK